MQEENIVKRACKELGVTQKELAEMMGVAEVTMNKWSANPNNITQQGIKAFDLLLENKKLKDTLSIVEAFKNYIKNS